MAKKTLLDNTALADTLTSIDARFRQGRYNGVVNIKIDYQNGGNRHVDVATEQRISDTVTKITRLQRII